ncbi:restriction endonuclease subunit S [Candidatus Dojkabacteria bacterium]|nr:restriction endonuclease subunit S [Candidatus Dojkabacteria bacterium]
MKKQYKLKDIGAFKGGVTSIKPTDYGYGTPFITYKNIFQNPKVDINMLTLMNVPKKDLQKCSCKYGDIFFTASSEVFEEVAMSSVLLDKGIKNLTFNGFSKRFRLFDFNTLLPEYAVYYFRSREFRNSIAAITTGDIRFNVSQENLSNITITLPPLSEQKRIANILSSFDNKIEILKKENKILEDIAENIFKEWFVKYNFPNKDGKPYRDSNGKMIDSELGPIPDGWRVGKLGEIVDVTSGKALPKDELKSDGQYPLLGANGEIGRTDKYLLNKTVIYTGRVGTLGNVFLYDAPAWYSDNTLIISPTQSFLYYIFFVLQRQQLEKLDRGSTQPLITQTDLKNILVVIPDNDILTLFNKTIQGGNDRITMSKRLLKTLDKIKTALLYKLLG